MRRFGKNGYDLARHAHGLDDRPIIIQHERKSVSQETTYDRDVSDGDKLRRTLREQAADVSRVLVRQQLAGATVKLKLRWPDFTTITRQVTLSHPTADAAEIYTAAVQLFEREWQGQAVRLIGVGVSSFQASAPQPSLWDQPNPKEERLYDAVRDLRQRFGEQAVRKASELEDENADEHG